MAEPRKTPRPLRIAAGLLIAGLAVEGASLAGLHSPAGFLTFALLGGLLIVAGIVAYLWGLISAGSGGGGS